LVDTTEAGIADLSGLLNMITWLFLRGFVRTACSQLL
jgi:hypothetical protein